MKYLFFLLMMFSTLFSSCRPEKKTEISEDVTRPGLSANEMILSHSEKDFPQEWKLKSMGGMMKNSEKTGEEMEYQEIYRFLPDKTFSKKRIQKNVETKASGTFVITRTGNGEEYFKLSYRDKNKLIENCDGGKQELLIISNGNTIRGTANACDLPSKTYEKL